jgi:excisionase family DNA binding protein
MGLIKLSVPDSTPSSRTPDRLLPLNIVAEMLGIRRRTVLNKINYGKLKAVDVGQGKRPTWRVWRSEVERYIASGTTDE